MKIVFDLSLSSQHDDRFAQMQNLFRERESERDREREREIDGD